MSASSSSSPMFSATVRMMKPAPGGRSPSIFSRSSWRVTSSSILREMPM